MSPVSLPEFLFLLLSLVLYTAVSLQQNILSEVLHRKQLFIREATPACLVHVLMSQDPEPQADLARRLPVLVLTAAATDRGCIFLVIERSAVFPGHRKTV